MTRWSLLLLLGCTPLQSRVARDAADDAPLDACVPDVCAPPPGPPGLVAPLSGSSVRTPRPALRWRPGADSTATRITLCRDRSMSNECRGFTASASASPPEDLSPGVWFWRASAVAGGALSQMHSAVWQLRVGTVDSAQGPSLDLDSDGLVELISSAPRVSNFSGRIYVFEGPGRDPESDVTAVRRGTVGSELGIALSHAGDVNRDGFTDLFAGAQGANQAVLYLGGSEGIASTPIRLDGPEESERFGRVVAGVGDLNGDGFDDVAVGARSTGGRSGFAAVYLGRAEGLANPPDQTLRVDALTSLDVYVAAAGDVNGDGFSDLALGVNGADGNTGLVQVFHGGATGLSETPSTTLRGVDIAGQFGLRLGAAGDVNGDGYGDLFVAAPEAMGRTGRVRLFTGGPHGLGVTPLSDLVGPAPGAGFGLAIAPPSDFDGDGFCDLVAGAPGLPVFTGSVRVHRGGTDGINPAPMLIREGLDGVDSLYGYLVHAADLNQDGRSDLVVSSPGVAGNTGRLYLYMSARDGWAERPLPLTGRDGMQGVFGWSLAWAPRPVVDPRGWL